MRDCPAALPPPPAPGRRARSPRSQTLLQELQNEYLVAAQCRAAGAPRAPLGLGLRNGLAHEVRLDERRMDIIFAAYGPGVAQPLGDRVDGGDDIAVRLTAACRRAAAAQLARGEHRAAPGAEVLGADVAGSDRAQVVVDVVR